MTNDVAMLTNVILCGGRGARLLPLTEEMPKTLVPLNNKPCLQYILEAAIRKGQRHFVLCIGYRGAMIREFIERMSFDAEIEFADAGESTGILERLYHARHLMGERAFISYGDTLIDVNQQEMLQEHMTHNVAVTLTTAEVRSPFGLVTMRADRQLLSFEEKPALPYYIGHMLMERSVLDAVSADVLHLPDGQGLVCLFQRLVAARRIRAYPYQGPQITFNTHQELDQAERDVHSFFTQDEGGQL